MSSLYAATVVPVSAMLGTMGQWLDKVAPADEAKMIAARLAPDMHPLPNQFQIASDAAKGMVARLTGTEAPAMADTETTFAELKDRVARTRAFLDAADPAAFDAGATREIVITFPNGAGLKMDGAGYATRMALPNFYFHATTAYAILRANGVALGKQDFLASLAPYMFAPPAA